MFSIIRFLENKLPQTPKAQIDYLFILTIIVFIKFIIVPLYDVRQKSIEEVETLALQKRNIRSVEESIRDYKETTSQLEELEKAYSDFIYKVPNLQRLQLDLEKAISKRLKKDKLQQQKITWTPIESEGTIKALGVSIAIRGSAIDIQKVIDEFEQQVPRKVILTMFLRSQGTSDQTVANLNFQVFYEETDL